MYDSICNIYWSFVHPRRELNYLVLTAHSRVAKKREPARERLQAELPDYSNLLAHERVHLESDSGRRAMTINFAELTLHTSRGSVFDLEISNRESRQGALKLYAMYSTSFERIAKILIRREACTTASTHKYVAIVKFTCMRHKKQYKIACG
jgi:hypothetical protein